MLTVIAENRYQFFLLPMLIVLNMWFAPAKFALPPPAEDLQLYVASVSDGQTLTLTWQQMSAVEKYLAHQFGRWENVGFQVVVSCLLAILFLVGWIGMHFHSSKAKTPEIRFWLRVCLWLYSISLFASLVFAVMQRIAIQQIETNGLLGVVIPSSVQKYLETIVGQKYSDHVLMLVLLLSAPLGYALFNKAMKRE